MAITYTPIATQTLGSTASSVTFSSIPSTYTDLVLVTNPAASGGDVGLQFNGDTSTNYSYTVIKGNGTTATSVRTANTARLYMVYDLVMSTDFSFNAIANIMNYSNTTTYKSAVIRSNKASQGVEAMAGIWRNTAAINEVKVLGSVSFAVGSTFTLYGIKAA